MGTSNPVNNWIFLYKMNVLYLHTNPCRTEISDLIADIVTNIKSTDIHPFVINYLNFKFYSINKFHKIRKFIKENNIDIVHTYHYIDAYDILKASSGLNVNVVFSCYSNDIPKGIYGNMYKKVISKVDAVIFQTEIHKKEFISKQNNESIKYFTLYHGFSSERLDNYEYKSLRDEFFIDDLRYLIGTLGDFSPKHDVMNVLKMVRKLRKSGRNFTCLISGAINDRYDSYFDECKYYYLMQGLENYIVYVGDKNDHANYISQLDAFVYHSDNEVVALPVIKAMMMGVNVIVNDSEMIKEITHNGKYATLYKTKDEVSFAEKTRYILLGLDDFKIIAETVKEECRMIFSIEKHISGLINIYNQININ